MAAMPGGPPTPGRFSLQVLAKTSHATSTLFRRMEAHFIPFFQPDGKGWKRIGRQMVTALWCLCEVKRHNQDYGLYTLEPTTGTLKELPGSKGLTEPRWSPDGRFIAAVDDANHKLLLYDVQKSRWTQLASGGFLESLHWAHDSSMIYFQDQIDEQESVFRGSLASRKVERVFGFGELLRGSATHCYFTGLDRTGSLYVMIERGVTDIYALDLDLP